MKNSKIDNDTKNVLLKIYNDIFIKIKQNSIDVFLCGGASKKNYRSIRDQIREKMDKYRDYRILYPEDLFAEILNKNKKHDLLSLERFLANNCDVICIVCESDGALVELGAFTNNEKTIHKVIAVIDEKRKRDRSFLMLGPVKILKRMSDSQVVFYKSSNLEELNTKLQKAFRTNKMKNIKEKNGNFSKKLNTITGLYHFIPVLLYFFNKLSVDNISEFLKYLFRENQYRLEEFDTLFRSSLKLLYKDKYISKNSIEGSLVYLLTDKGYKNVNNILGDANICNRTILYDRIRFDIIKKQYYL
ncbi:retron St85 family effector protein [Priestia aryabhattai]